MPSKDTNILAFNQHQKSNKSQSIIYPDLESLIKIIDGCKNNFEKSYTGKVCEHIPCRYLMSPIWTFDSVENKHDKDWMFKGQDSMKKFCQSLRVHGTKIINFEKKKIIPLTNEKS